MESKNTLLVLDLDGTLTKSDNLVQFSLFMVKKKKEIKFYPFCFLMGLLKFGIIDNRSFKILYAKWILRNLKVADLNRNVSEFLKTEKFKKDINKCVFDFIKQYNEAEKIIVSANYSFLVGPISRIFNISKQLSITLEIKNERYTGKIIEYIPYCTSKIEVLNSILNKKDYNKTIGVADSKSDIPLLKYLDLGFLVDFDKKANKIHLRQI